MNPNKAVQITPVPAGLLSCLLLIPLRGQETRQKRAGASDRRTFGNKMLSDCPLILALRDATLKEIIDGPCGVYLRFSSPNLGPEHTLEMLCCGRLVLFRGDHEPVLLVDGSNYIDRESLRYLPVGSKTIHLETDDGRRGFTVTFDNSKQIVFQYGSPKTEREIFLTLWEGEPGRSREAAKALFPS